MNHFQTIIIGSGFGGQCAAMKLNKLGLTDYVILERRDFMGGTWCQNTYPGAAVDVQSPLYSIEAEPYQWSQMFAEQAELEQYTNYVIDKHGLRDKTRTNTNVERVHWDEVGQQWVVSSNAGEFTAQFLINASGPLSTPMIPNFNGRDNFAGTSFHTNNWDWNYDYKGKRVAVIGSGASAAQAIPAMAGDVAEMHVFQRSPHWVLPRPDRKFGKFARWLLGKKPMYKLLRSLIYWTLEYRVLGFKYSKTMLKLVAQRKAERFIKKTIRDPQLQKALTPDFTIGCKRIILSSTLYPALDQDNIHVHTKEDGIAEINESGILTTQGHQVDVDLIVYATGYCATDGVISYPVEGREGRTIAQQWAEFPRAYLGTSLPGFPNLFIITGPNTGIGHTSAIFVIEAQLNYIAKAIKSVVSGGHRAIEVTEQAEENYTQMIHSEMEKTVWKSGGCNSWYQSKSGHVIAMFPGFSFTYRRMASAFKAKHHRFIAALSRKSSTQPAKASQIA
ncbi:NAD(P)/FAD-dependent oxidoreductase [Spongiibacter sp. KMU-158]|uniref:NAD(P)/FAD-dependent oxidoreductase n=1 Tax=Spongiibacter pelagi TaxID=2760804 RepID=A0A927GXK5_9GAMM|nr:NAD(P)/FAD-dependent oxidoreductase [Spongiibacter pelagi]MBD2859519.1 NAD(P)/FAD-dependent oxidoreductase [Spongiibacter pelagi]